MIRLTFNLKRTPTPEELAWLAEVERRLNEEADRRLENLMVYGCTHPESAAASLELASPGTARRSTH